MVIKQSEPGKLVEVRRKAGGNGGVVSYPMLKLLGLSLPLSILHRVERGMYGWLTAALPFEDSSELQVIQPDVECFTQTTFYSL